MKAIGKAGAVRDGIRTLVASEAYGERFFTGIGWELGLRRRMSGGV